MGLAYQGPGAIDVAGPRYRLIAGTYDVARGAREVSPLLQRASLSDQQARRSFVQHFTDKVTLGAVNEIETLVTGLSGKIWQKITLSIDPAEQPQGGHNYL